MEFDLKWKIVHFLPSCIPNGKPTLRLIQPSGNSPANVNAFSINSNNILPDQDEVPAVSMCIPRWHNHCHRPNAIVAECPSVVQRPETADELRQRWMRLAASRTAKTAMTPMTEPVKCAEDGVDGVDVVAAGEGRMESGPSHQYRPDSRNAAAPRAAEEVVVDVLLATKHSNIWTSMMTRLRRLVSTVLRHCPKWQLVVVVLDVSVSAKRGAMAAVEVVAADTLVDQFHRPAAEVEACRHCY